MSNIVEFVMKMKDMMSSGLIRAGATSQTTFARMRQDAQQQQQRNQVLGMSYNELKDKIKAVEDVIANSKIPDQISAARVQLAALQRMANSHQGRSSAAGFTSSLPSVRQPSSGGMGISELAVGNMLGNFAMSGLSKAQNLVESGIQKMISNTFQKEQDIIGLSTFLGKDGATEAYNNIRKDADSTPFDTASLLEVNRALISAGINAKDSRRDTMNLANAVAAVGGGNDVLSRMAANMQQIKTVGKATAMDIRQFGMTGINIYQMLSKATGKSIEEVKEMDVSYELLAQSLQMEAQKGGIYFGALDAQSKTMAGRWSTVMDKFDTGLSDIGDAFAPVFDKFLNIGVAMVESINPGLQLMQPNIDAIANGIGRAVDFFTNIATGTSEWNDYIVIAKDMFGITWNYVKLMGQKVWHILSGIIEWIKKSEIVKDIFRVAAFIVEKVFKIIGWLMDKVVWFWDNVVKPILNTIEKVYKWLKGTNEIKVSANNKVTIVPKPKPTGAGPDNAPINPKMIAGNVESGKKVGESVVGGGPKTINITVQKFFEDIHFNSLNSKESYDELEKKLLELLTRVVYNGSKLV